MILHSFNSIKMEEAEKSETLHSENQEEESTRVTIQLKSEENVSLGSPFDIPISVTSEQLQLLCNSLLNLEDPVPCSFFVENSEIHGTLAEVFEEKAREKLNEEKNNKKRRRKNQEFPSVISFEKVYDVVYQPQAVFRVAAVTRCTSTLPGHGEAVTSVQFSPDGRHLASGSGDTTVRFWDLSTELPLFTCKGHKHHVLFVAWSPNGKKVASACKNGQIFLWNPETGEQLGAKPLTGHKKWINWLCWEPLHQDPSCVHLASASKDGDIRIWDTVLGTTVRVLAGHTGSATCIKWGGEGLLYSASQDRTIRVWRTKDGVLCRNLQGHGHWVNTMALNTDYALRTGAYDPQQGPLLYDKDEDQEILKERARKRYMDAKGSGPERLVSGSDDFTLFLWQPEVDKKPLGRMTGHQQLINQVLFSPDGRIIASASFDKSIKLWEGKSGKYLASLRGHVQAVYQIAWSADSRLLVSGSADSTLKIWNVSKRELAMDLPGHADEVYAVDWSPDGQRVCSGGKDKVLKMWRK